MVSTRKFMNSKLTNWSKHLTPWLLSNDFSTNNMFRKLKFFCEIAGIEIFKCFFKMFWPHCAKVQSTRRRAIYLQKRFQFYLITNLGPFSVLLQYIYILASHISVNTQCGHRCIFEKFKRCFYIGHEICSFLMAIIFLI